MDNSKIGHHISEQFNKELEDIRNKVLTMGGLVEQQIELPWRLTRQVIWNWLNRLSSRIIRSTQWKWLLIWNVRR